MFRRKSLHQAILTTAWLAACLVVASGCRCQDERADSSLPETAWALPESFTATDASLTAEQYASLGLPPIDRNWSSEDMNQAATRLAALAEAHPEQLPRLESPRSGPVFARLASRDNWRAFDDSALPVALRFPAAATELNKLNSIVKLYAAAANKKMISANDLAELNVTRLFAATRLLTLTDAVRANLGSDNASQPSRLDALEQMRHALGDMVIEILSGISNPRLFGLTARKRLLDGGTETLGAIVTKLTPQARDELLARLEEAAANPMLANLQPGLNQLRDQVRVAATARGRRP